MSCITTFDCIVLSTLKFICLFHSGDMLLTHISCGHTNCSYFICFCRGWIGHVFALLTLSIAIFMLLTRCCSQGMLDNELRVVAPTEMNTVEQLLAVQNAISQVEELVQDGNIVLFKLRAFLLAVSPQVMVFPPPFLFLLASLSNTCFVLLYTSMHVFTHIPSCASVSYGFVCARGCWAHLGLHRSWDWVNGNIHVDRP